MSSKGCFLSPEDKVMLSEYTNIGKMREAIDTIEKAKDKKDTIQTPKEKSGNSDKNVGDDSSVSDTVISRCFNMTKGYTKRVIIETRNKTRYVTQYMMRHNTWVKTYHMFQFLDTQEEEVCERRRRWRIGKCTHFIYFKSHSNSYSYL